MPKDIFSSNVEQNAPGLAYATPKALEAKQNSVEGLVKGLNTMIPAVVNYDKGNVLSEATDRANEMANEYKLGSETHINNLTQEQQRLNSELQAGGDSSEITNRLNDIEGQLNLATEQGRIGPGEFKHRMMKAAQDLTNDNPAYQLEIANKMNAVFGATGVTSILALDATLLQTRVDAQIARKQLKIKTVEKYEDTTGRSDAYINERFQIYKNAEGQDEKIKQIISQLSNASNLQKWKVYSTFEKNGGYGQFSNTIYANITGNLRAIGANPEASIDQKIRQSNDIIQQQINLLLHASSILPPDAKTGEFISSNLVNQLKGIQKEMLESTDKTNAVRVAENRTKLVVARNKFALNQRWNIPALTASANLEKLLEGISHKSQPIMRMRDELSADIILDISKMSSDGLYGKTGDDVSMEGLGNPGGTALISQLTIDNRNNAKKDLADNGELTTANINLYVTDLTLPASTLSKDALVKHYDTYLYNSITQTDDKVMDFLETIPSYNTAVNNAFNEYTEMTRQSLGAIIGDNIVRVSLNKSNSSLFISQDDPMHENNPQAVARIQNNLMRVNRLIRMNAKVSGKSLEEEAEKIIAEDFNMILGLN